MKVNNNIFLNNKTNNVEENIDFGPSNIKTQAVNKTNNNSIQTTNENALAEFNENTSVSNLNKEDIETIKQELKRHIEELKKELENTKNTRGFLTKFGNKIAETFGKGDKSKLEEINNFEKLLKGLDSNPNNIQQVYQTIMNTPLDETRFSNLQESKQISNLIDSEAQNEIVKVLEDQVAEIENNFKTAQNQNGWIEKAWDGIKNGTGIGASSNKTQAEINSMKAQIEALKNGSSDLAVVYKNITGVDLTKEELEQFLTGEKQLSETSKAGESVTKYSEGQKMAVDVVADMASGIVSIIAVSAAPFTGGASLALGFAVGAALKVGIKASDCIGNEKKYGLKDFGYDALTGGINGLMAPITNGLGGAVGTGVAKAFGLEALETTAKESLGQVVKTAGKEIVEETIEQGAKQTGKNLLTRILAKQGVEYVAKEGAESTLKTSIGKLLAYGADMAVDGSISGATDNVTRAVAEGRFEDIPEDALNGFKGGLIAAPLFGGTMRGATKVGGKILNKASKKVSLKPLKRSMEIGSISKSTIQDLLKLDLDNTQMKRAVKLLNELNSDIPIDHLEAYAKAPLSRQSSIRDCLWGTNEMVVCPPKVRYSNATKIAEMSDDNFKLYERFKELGVHDNFMLDLIDEFANSPKKLAHFDELQMKFNDIDVALGVAALDEELYERTLALLNKGVDQSNVLAFAELDKVQYDRALTLLDKGVDERDVPTFAKLDKVKYDRALTLLDKCKSKIHISDFATFDKVQYERALTLLDRCVFEPQIADLVKLNDVQYERLLALLDKNIVSKNIAMIECDADEFDKILKLADHLNESQILKYAKQNKISEILDSRKFKNNADLISKVNNGEGLYPESRNMLVDMILGLYSDDYSSLTLYEKLRKIDVLKNAQQCEIFAEEEKNFLGIDSRIAELEASIKKVIKTTDVPFLSTKKMMKGFFANNNANLDELLSKTDYAKYGKEGLPLKYSRKAFLSDLTKEIQGVSVDEQDDIVRKLGISLIKDNQGNITGYDGIIDLSQLSKDGTEGKISSLVNKFIKENKVVTGNAELDEALNSLIEGIPEFVNIIGKQQHGTHDLSVDIHMLTVLKEIISNPNYKTLSNDDKFCLKFAAIMHDISKQENIIDEGHDVLSALYVRDILNKTCTLDDGSAEDLIKLPSSFKDRIYELVKNHHWLKKYNTEEIDAKTVATYFRRTDDLKMAQIMAAADLKGVNENFYKTYSSALSEEMQKPIEEALERINGYGQLVLTNKIIDPKKVPIVTQNGVDYKVINLAKLTRDVDLQRYGFEPGTSVDDLRLLIHMVNEYDINGLENVNNLADPSYEGYLCSSYASLKNKRTYRNYKYGVSLEAEQANIGNASSVNQGSGCGKNFSSFMSHLTYDMNRGLVSKTIEESLGLTDSEYAELFSKLQKLKNLNTLDFIKEIKVGDKTLKGKDVKRAITTANDLLFTAKQQNELNLYSPKINGVVAKVDDLSEVPQELLEFANKHNLPIFLLGK